jgi:hypothetical protein
VVYALRRVWHGSCDYFQREATHKGWLSQLKLERSGAYMFDGKNNRLLDSFSFRLALTAAVFAVWSGAGYLLLSLA